MAGNTDLSSTERVDPKVRDHVIEIQIPVKLPSKRKRYNLELCGGEQTPRGRYYVRRSTRHA